MSTQARGFKVDIVNGRELRSALRMAGIDMADMKVVNNRVANLVLNAATVHVPRRRGRLASSGRANRAQAQAVVTYSVPYANPIHWGWRARGIGPQPWLQSAGRRTEPTWVQLYQTEVQNILNDVELEA